MLVWNFIQSRYYDQDNLLRYVGMLYFDKQYERMLPVLQSVLEVQPENWGQSVCMPIVILNERMGKNAWSP